MNDFAATLLNLSAGILPHAMTIIVALVVGLGVFVLRRKIVALLARIIKKLTAHLKCSAEIVDAAVRPAVSFMVVLAIYLFLTILLDHFFPDAYKAANFLTMALKISLISCIAWIAMEAVIPLLKQLQIASDKLDDTIAAFLSKIIKIVILVIAAVIIVDEVGYDITGIITGIGLGGLVVTLGAQDTAKNLFGGIVIVIDKPFEVGDWIEVTGLQGVVTDISLRSTRVRSFKDSEMIIPNSTLANASIINWSRMNKRKVEMNMAVVPQTSPDKLEAATEAIRQILRSHAHVDKDEIVAVLNEFSATAVTLMISYFLVDTTFEEHMNVKEEINLQIMRRLADDGLLPPRNP